MWRERDRRYNETWSVLMRGFWRWGLCLCMLWAMSGCKKKSKSATSSGIRKASAQLRTGEGNARNERNPGTVRNVAGLSNAKVVWIPAGTFRMGSPSSEPGRDQREGPIHRVRLTRSFWMWQTEVTQGQYRAVMNTNPSFFRDCGSRCPVDSVNWSDALLFANRLSQQQGRETCYTCSGGQCQAKARFRANQGRSYSLCKGWRLPTEAEWEYAARTGRRGTFYTGRCLSTKAANYDGNGPLQGCPGGSFRRTTTPVRSFRPNPWGLYDMLGNVYEWVYDSCCRKYPRGLVSNPIHLYGTTRLLRGGGWNSTAINSRAAVRIEVIDWPRFNAVGFRVVRTP